MKSSLSYSIIANITEDIYWRGFDYFRKHKVGEIKESEKNLLGFVHGSEMYTVEFRQGPKYLKAYEVSAVFAKSLGSQRETKREKV